VTGANVDRSGIVWEEGDADRPVALDAATLRPVPWREGTAQVLGGVRDRNGDPFFADPRHLVREAASRFGELGLTPVAALELEFHLLDGELGPDGRPQNARCERLGGRGAETEVFLPERLDDEARFFALVDRYAEAQGVALKSTVCEYAPGQYELNLGHGGDMLRAADEAAMLKRLVKAAARDAGRRATFMAKPFEDQSGSGLHVHLSLLDRSGRNALAAEPDLLRHAAAGLLATMAEGMLVWAPNANSYRRLRPGSYAPTAATWGENNRTVAVRVPPGPAAARRVEHRVAGADANPYLVLAAVLAGVHHGIANRLDAPEPVAGNAYEGRHPPLPSSWESAIAAFRRGRALSGYLGARFAELFAAGRESERARFEARVTPTEYAWYLGSV
jgi:glutamine synthetase